MLPPQPQIVLAAVKSILVHLQALPIFKGGIINVKNRIAHKTYIYSGLFHGSNTQTYLECRKHRLASATIVTEVHFRHYLHIYQLEARAKACFNSKDH